uniref:Epstein-Barr virus EBNA-1-like protein n=1 Tax=Oryza sativa subsp. japonica TaxID=39947 RepID=Q6YYQ7_ORYSJ|nr:Epstein-Barr virus EBNA-1-like protein [Oryza sativa Japonica Group]BAD03805.1 Epstein-Barr virus EBNA-1-like protein [Oryza sativa Japonica Group]
MVYVGYLVYALREHEYRGTTRVERQGIRAEEEGGYWAKPKSKREGAAADWASADLVKWGRRLRWRQRGRHVGWGRERRPGGSSDGSRRAAGSGERRQAGGAASTGGRRRRRGTHSTARIRKTTRDDGRRRRPISPTRQRGRTREERRARGLGLHRTGATRRGGKGEGRWPRDSQGELKGISGSVAARGIGSRGADGGRLRRRQSPASKRGKHNETTRIRFKGVGASPGFKESVSGVGWGGEALRRAGDEQRPPGADGNGGEAMPGDGGAREWFGEVLGSSRTVLARVVDELGPDDGARLRAAAETEQRRGARRIVRQAMACGGGRGIASGRRKGFGGELTDKRKRRRRIGGSRGEVVAMVGRNGTGWARPGRKRGEVAPGAPRHAPTHAPVPPVLGGGRRRRDRVERQQGGDGAGCGASRGRNRARAIKERRWRTRGQVVTEAVTGGKGGDGVDALGGEGGGSSGGKSNRGSGRISTGWRGQVGGGELALASASLPPSACGQGVEAWRRCLGGKKRGRTVERGGFTMPVWEKGGGRGRGERVRQRDVLPPRLGRTRAQGGGERQGGMGGRAAQAARADAAATGRSATRGRARERAKAVAGFGRRRRESAPGGERAERESEDGREKERESERALSRLTCVQRTCEGG